MSRSQTKPKKVLSGRKKRSQVPDAEVLSVGTKLSEIRDAAGEVGGQGRSSTRRSVAIAARVKAVISDAPRKGPKATDKDSNVTVYAPVLAHAVETFGSQTNANAWLNRPNRMFANQTPLQILTEDTAAVEEELVRIDHGIFV